MADPTDISTPYAPQTTPSDPSTRIQSAASDVVEQGKSAAQSVMDQGKNAAQEALEKGKEKAQGAAECTINALRRAADDTPDEQAWIGGAFRKSADVIEQAAQSIASGDLNSAIEEVHSFARRQPAVFLGLSLALGFAAARLGKTAIENTTQQSASPHNVSTPSYMDTGP